MFTETWFKRSCASRHLNMNARRFRVELSRTAAVRQRSVIYCKARRLAWDFSVRAGGQATRLSTFWGGGGKISRYNDAVWRRQPLPQQYHLHSEKRSSVLLYSWLPESQSDNIEQEIAESNYNISFNRAGFQPIPTERIGVREDRRLSYCTHD